MWASFGRSASFGRPTLRGVELTRFFGLVRAKGCGALRFWPGAR
jgi:hypothetical protein